MVRRFSTRHWKSRNSASFLKSRALAVITVIPKRPALIAISASLVKRPYCQCPSFKLSDAGKVFLNAHSDLGGESLLSEINRSLLTQIGRPDRKAAETFTGGSEDSVGHSRSNRRNAGLADASRPLVVVDDMHFNDGWRFVYAQDFVVVEIRLNDAAVRNSDFAF